MKSKDINSAENLSSFSKEFLVKTKHLFEPIAKRNLREEECAQIARNMIGLENVLKELSKKYE